MQNILQISCLVYLIQYVSASFDPLLFFGRPKYGTVWETLSAQTNPSAVKDIVQGFFEQKLDHFSNDSITWAQRYIRREHAFPRCVFLVLGGNGELPKSWFLDSNSPYVKWAMEYGADLYGLEHRYYGESLPVNNQSIENMGYLTTDQVIEDVAYFINETKKDKKGLKWIVFGGSTAGSIAVWIRQKYPDLVIGAVGSSSPLEAKLDFYEYNRITETAFKSNEPCYTQIQQSFQELITKTFLKTARAELNTLLKLSNIFDNTNDPIDYQNAQFLFWTLQQPFQLAAQYQGVNTVRFDTRDVSSLCSTVFAEQAASIGELLKALEFMSNNEITKVENDYQQAVASLQLVNLKNSTDPTFEASRRTWLWQLCTEFGFFPTTDSGNSDLFDSTVNPSLFANLCYNVFDISVDQIQQSISRFNKKFGGMYEYSGTNVVLTYGTLDPWQDLMKKRSTDKSVIIIPISGCGHAADVYILDTNKPNYLNIKSAYDKISVQLNQWLYVEDSVTETLPTSSSSNRIQVRASNSTLVIIQKDVVVEKSIRIPAQFAFGRPPYGFTPLPSLNNSATTSAGSEIGYFSQRIDHEDEFSDFFQQQYFRNSKFSTSEGPIILLISGESEASLQWIVNKDLPLVQLAEKLGATLYMLEHRFYGDSIIQGSSLKHLTVGQALSDISGFIQSASKKEGPNRKWITVGSSYGGLLAVLSRALYPDYVLGSIGSSALLTPKFDFYENLHQVEWIIRNHSADCANKVEDAFNQLHTSTMNSVIPPAFQSFSQWTHEIEHVRNQQYFYMTLYSIIQGSLIHTSIVLDDDKAEIGVKKLCDAMTSSGDVLTGLANFINDANTLYSIVNTLTLQEYINVLKNPQTTADTAATNWVWQSCNELASFPTTDSGQTIFGSPTPVDFFIYVCKQVFEILPESYSSVTLEEEMRLVKSLLDNIEETTNRLILTNGALDPRLPLSLLEVDNNNITTITISETGHSSLLYPALNKTSSNQVQAQQIVLDKVREWLNISPNSTDNTNTTTAKPNSSGYISIISTIAFYFIILFA